MALTRGAEKWKGKKWYNVYPPELLGNNVIGEMPADDEARMTGRIIKSNMSWITNKMEHSFTVVGLKVTEINGNAAHTQLKYLEQTYSYLHSLVKRHSSAIYTVDALKDKNGRAITLKLLVVTRNKITGSKKKAVRSELNSFSKEYSAGKDDGELVKAIIDGSFQSQCMQKVSKIAEIAKLELKRLELESQPKAGGAAAGQKSS